MVPLISIDRRSLSMLQPALPPLRSSMRIMKRISCSGTYDGKIVCSVDDRRATLCQVDDGARPTCSSGTSGNLRSRGIRNGRTRALGALGFEECAVHEQFPKSPHKTDSCRGSRLAAPTG
jgi:hypothetical protein